MFLVTSHDSEQILTPSTPSFGESDGLPHEILPGTTRRLGSLALGIAVSLSIALAFPMTLGPILGGKQESIGGARMVVALCAIVLSLSVFGLTRAPFWKLVNTLKLGLTYQVAICFTIAVLQFWKPDSNSLVPAGSGVSWVIVCILIFAVILPTSPLLALGISGLSAAWVPLVFWLSLESSGEWGISGSSQSLFTVTILHLAFAFVAYACSRAIHSVAWDRHGLDRTRSYQLIDMIGRGSMGEVWRANHHLLARPAAIKLIRPELVLGMTAAERKTTLDRFVREAKAIAGMRCPHTVNLYDFGVAHDGTIYYVMEVLEGVDLQSLITHFGSLPAARVIHILRQACCSLAEAHVKGVVHRDVKPANLCLCQYGLESDFVKVLDFGLAKVVGTGTLTRSSGVIGTAAYMAPEQILADRAIDGRADIYSLGCVAYWLITGQLVFHGESVTDIMAKHVREKPIAPSLRSELRIDEELDGVILACLEKEPGRRPQSAGELAARLESCPSMGRWTPEDARDWWRTHNSSIPREHLSDI